MTKEGSPGRPEVQALPDLLDDLIVAGRLNPSKAYPLLTSKFSDLTDGLRQESKDSGSSQEIERLYKEQFEHLLRDSESSLKAFVCGIRVCAAEISRAPGTEDPMSSDPDEILPRNALFEVSTLEGGLVVRRFMFSIDPRVDSLATPRTGL